MALTYDVPVSYTINVSLTAQPAGLADYNTNSIALFTNDPVSFVESYQAAMSLASVGDIAGNTTLTYKMAQGMFSQAPNFRSGNGILYVFPFAGVNASAGSGITADISAKLTNLKLVTN